MSLTSADMIRRRFGDHRPGLQLISVVDAAVPVTMLRVDVLAQERKPLPLLDEFILRFVHAGVKQIEEIARLLGLQREQVVAAVADQISGNNVTRAWNGQLSLSALGLEAARNLAAVQPVLTQLNVPFDRLVWNTQDYARSSLIKKRDAREAGMELLPAKKTSRVHLSDLTVERFNELVDSRDDRTRQVEVLRVRKIASQSLHLYMPAQLLVYGDPDSGEVELGLCVEGDLQPAHGLELAAADAVVKLGVAVAQPEPRPTLSPELEDQRLSGEEVDIIRAAGDRPSDAGPAEASPAPQRVEDIAVRSVGVHEHPQLLSQALNGAKRRLLIIAPWVKGGVVNTDFVAAIERRLRAGVDVHIGHGYGPDDSGSDDFALRKLTNLAARYDKLRVVRLENTHAKILIFDDQWITTSFNWLSFKGDPDRTYRMEEGTLVQIPSEVEKAFQRYLDILDTDGADPRLKP
ncbi:phospholipase D-like domain-containing protein [Pseudactinotalea terrae]|uniref:phospholipase D-like domain-containing protein n=1 Tax=Pseudactinotalea terrae TaxID=1743262 RepID=UPI0012E26598|nr:phospholipase D-like domain-containing protein [Pseudactinotalea terrae]